jgi:putative transposase
MHYFDRKGVYMITAGTYSKEHFLKGEKKLDYFQENLFKTAKEFDWRLSAWSIFSNHYHLIASSADPSNLSKFINKLHTTAAIAINEMDETPGRKIWHQYWETHLSFQQSYLARLKYVHKNPVKHGLVSIAEDYKWCSANWFKERSSISFSKSVDRFKIDKLKIIDDF